MLSTQASKAYTKGLAFWMTLYVIGLFGSIMLIKTYALPDMAKYLLAFAPALPIGGTIMVFLRFIRDSDEYVRALHAERFIRTTGVLLFAACIWGFMQNFANAPAVELWWSYPAFWFIYGLMNCLPVRRS